MNDSFHSLGATSIARIGEVWLSDELGGLRFSSKILNFSLLEYVDLPMQTGFKTALRKQILDIDTNRSNMSRDHKNYICSMGSRRRI